MLSESVSDAVSSFLRAFNDLVWGAPFFILFFGLAIYYTIALRGIQLRYLPKAFKLAFGKQDEKSKGDISRYESLMTTLAATIGIGNIAGVATAVTAGGVGALFWMWVTAILGMVTKYAEAILAVKYREVDERGEMSGGPMYFIEKGLGWRPLALAFALFGALVSLGGGNMIQSNSVADVMLSVFDVPPWVTGVVMAFFVGLSIFGGIKSIGKVAGILVPFMATLYLLGSFFIMYVHIDLVPSAFLAMFTEAFSGEAVSGGFLGMMTSQVVRTGLSRGLMTSEAGLGTGSIAAAAARTDCPGTQALVSMTSSFLTTVIMCSVTAIILQVTGAIGAVDAAGVPINGASLTVRAFQTVFSWGGVLVSISLVFFAFTTVLGYAYYAEKCMEYLLGAKSVPLYRVLFTVVVGVGAVLQLDIVWLFSDIANGLMAYPNLIGMLFLAPVVVKESNAFTANLEV